MTTTGINLPNGGNVQLPPVPEELIKSHPRIFDYLSQTRLALQQIAQGQFANTFLVATAMNSGTSGVFLINSGGHITVTSGIVISVTTT